MTAKLNKYGEIEINDSNCPACGKELKEEWVACPYCGANLLDTSDKSNKNIASGLRVNRSDERPTADSLQKAICEGDIALLKQYIRSGGNINDYVIDPFTLLQWAVIQGQEEIVKFLINAGADINLPDDDGDNSPIHLAVDYSDHGKKGIAILDMLISAGAYINAKDSIQSTPLDSAAMQAKKEAFMRLRAAGAQGDRKIISKFQEWGFV